MTIVAAGVHLAVVFAGVLKGVELLHGQGVHVGAQANGTPAGAAVAAMHDAHHTRLAQPAVDGNAPFGELARHHIGGAHFFKAQLGVGMDIPAHRCNTRGLGDDGVDNVHDMHPYDRTV